MMASKTDMLGIRNVELLRSPSYLKTATDPPEIVVLGTKKLLPPSKLN
jgi:hypothetical protein